MKHFTWRFEETESTCPTSYRLLVKSRTVPGALVSWESALLGEIAACCHARACPARESEQKRRGAGAGSGSTAVELLLPPCLLPHVIFLAVSQLQH